MALEKTFVTAQGFEALNAYHRIEKIDVVSKTEMIATVKSYKNKPDETSIFLSGFSVSLPFDINGFGVFAQAYIALKKTSEFIGATDC